LHRQILSKGVINLKGKKIHVRPSQVETTKGKIVIISESREKMRSTTKKSKPLFDELLAKYKKGNAPWLGWYALLIQYELFYPRSSEHEPNTFDRSACPRKDHFYPKNQLNAAKTHEQPNWKFWFRNLEALIFPARVGHTRLKKVYRGKQKTNSNESLSLNTQDEKPIFANDKKQQQSTNINSGARTWGHELEKNYSSEWNLASSLIKTLSERMMF
jgi:hypothetical protein